MRTFTKNIRPGIFRMAAILVLFFAKTTINAQCPNGLPSGGTAYDTTILTPSGITTMHLMFPKFNPDSGLVTCVKLCVTITGVIDSVSVENNSSSVQPTDIYYIRTDNITGPGLLTPINNSINQHYGTYSLAATDGVPGAGPDFVSISHDTVLNAVQKCITISDSTTIADFYGLDSVTYLYDISAFTNISSGGSYNSFIATSAFVNFKFSYCTCPSSVLPLTIRSFDVKKTSTDKAELTWTGYDNPDDNYHYEMEMSRNGSNFTTIGKQPKVVFESSGYKFLYAAKNGNGTYFFRVKQVYSNGYSRFTDIKSVELENTNNPKINIYPNPSNGVVGIKFVNTNAGKFLVNISNTQGQTVFSNEIEASGGLMYITTLQKGMYWVRLIDVTSHLSCVNQLLIK
ncbi:MAG TPA: choice-of-anchor E domain-containing protein [Chitinophagaceae bacterium]|nr:choice-of-anchor E domain-containing protein [Chitinophagaceae bacterium]